MNTPTLKQKTTTIETASGVITVRRMYHKAAREFLKRLAAELAARAALFLPAEAAGAAGQTPGGQQPAKVLRYWPKFDAVLAQLPQLVASADDLADFLVANSIDDADLTKLDFPDWARVLAAAVELNCGPELKNSFAGIGEALAPLLAEMTKTSSGAGSTPS